MSLLRSGTSVDTPDSLGRTALHGAAWGGHTQLLAWLLDQRCRIDAEDQLGRTPLELAASRTLGPGQNDVEAVSLLLQRGARATHSDHQGLTALHRASWSNRSDLVRLLVQYGAKVDSSDAEGNRPLHLAAIRGYQPVLDLLLGAGADIRPRRVDGCTPLHLTLIHHPELTNYFLDHSAPVNVRDDLGSTPLHRAIFSGMTQAAAQLLETGADSEARDELGRTPLLRLHKNAASSLLVLQSHHARLEAVDKRGNNIVQVAKETDEPTLAIELENRHLHFDSPSVVASATPGEASSPGGSAPLGAPPLERPSASPSSSPPDRTSKLEALRQHVLRLSQSPVLPIIDVHFHLGNTMLPERVLEQMDAAGVAGLWLGPNPHVDARVASTWAHALPERFIPLVGHVHGAAWVRGERGLLQQLGESAATGQFFGLGEVEARHYATAENDRDVDLPVTAPQMHDLLKLSATYHLPLLLHHEAEDSTLDDLESMLSAYPQAPIIWAHAGRKRKGARSTRLEDPVFVASLLTRHSNLNLELVQSSPNAQILLYEQGKAGPTLSTTWKKLIKDFPDRFVLGSDANSLRLEDYGQTMESFRSQVLSALPADLAAALAYKNAWRLMTETPWPKT